MGVDELQIYTEIGGIPTEALVDTGSSISIINIPFYKKLKKVNPGMMLSPETRSATNVNGQPINNHGTVDLPLKWGHRSIHVKFWVMEVDLPCLIGRQFLKKHRAKLNLDTDQISIENITINLVRTAKLGSIPEEPNTSGIPLWRDEKYQEITTLKVCKSC